MITPDYAEMREICLSRMRDAGLEIGQRILFKGKRPGIIFQVNPFFFDAEPLRIVVDLDEFGRFKKRKGETVSLSDLSSDATEDLPSEILVSNDRI